MGHHPAIPRHHHPRSAGGTRLTDPTGTQPSTPHPVENSGSEAWPWIFPHMLRDDDDEVVRVAWRLAVAIVPEGAESELADVLVSQFDRGNMEVKTSLARALASLAAWYTPALDLVDAATRAGDLGVRIHATATRAIIHDPEIGFAGIFAEAKRSLGG